jgi:hypothetical protein
MELNTASYVVIAAVSLAVAGLVILLARRTRSR